MTRKMQKKNERIYAEEMARLMNESWDLGAERESPDFLVTDGAEKFGLEVCDIFTGTQSKAGSKMKEAESKTQKLINSFKQKYESATGIQLNAKFVGNICVENMNLALQLLTDADISSKEIYYRAIIDTDKGLRIHFVKMPYSDWYNVGDRAGWVNENPIPQITKAIEDKAIKLPEYIKATGEDVRLLLFANGYNNSGKLRLRDIPMLDTKGFKKVYFFSYPEAVTMFNNDGTSLFYPWK